MVWRPRFIESSLQPSPPVLACLCAAPRASHAQQASSIDRAGVTFLKLRTHSTSLTSERSWMDQHLLSFAFCRILGAMQRWALRRMLVVRALMKYLVCICPPIDARVVFNAFDKALGIYGCMSDPGADGFALKMASMSHQNADIFREKAADVRSKLRTESGGGTGGPIAKRTLGQHSSIFADPAQWNRSDL
ncbi:hypothetical protein DFH06DRAFT_8241 [Mycena polygramma]|nr:hypothetical protein DFH06DRAFT_8241 [Mycena polygramma]